MEEIKENHDQVLSENQLLLQKLEDMNDLYEASQLKFN
jgi:hypothetical protein